MSSGSADSELAVKPTRSQNNAVTTLRSSAGVADEPPSGVPQEPQNRCPSGFSERQAAQASIVRSVTTSDAAGASPCRNGQSRGLRNGVGRRTLPGTVGQAGVPSVTRG